ncbi:MAG: hypothetical protein HOG34_14720, partial [Bacteroidetes bacterium]|nr:hypothetical protein [Bacteroidota bacterium]
FIFLLSFPAIVCAQTSASERLASWNLHQKMEKESPFKHLEWQASGPMKQGGRIESIACPANDPSTIYVGVGSGNVWKTVNNGTTWKPIFEDESTFTIGALAVAQSDPEIIWVGTGEILMARSSYAGTGVFKSLNAGESWDYMGLPESHHIGRVLIDPQNPDIVYVAAMGHLYTYNDERGLYKTTDGGENWEKILYTSERTGCVDVFMHPDDNLTLFAIMWERNRKAWGHSQSGPESALYKSTDGGENWEKITNGLPSGEHIGRMGLAIAPSNPSKIYALIDNRTPKKKGVVGGELYQSIDHGKSWTKMNDDRIPTAIGYDFCLVRVSPDNENQIYILGNKLLRSDDGGNNYYEILGTLVHIQAHQSSVLHLDHHEMWIDPLNPNRILLGNDGGIHISWDRGDTWMHYNNIPIAECYAVTVDMADPFNIYIGTQDDAALFGPSDFVMKDNVSDPWTQIYVDPWGGGDSYFTYVDPADSNTIYYEHQFGDLVRKNMKKQEIKWIKPRKGPNGEKLKTNWMTPFFISAYDSNTLYYGANYLFKSTNRGDNWTVISPDLSTNPGPEKQGNVPFGTITSLSESILHQGLIYAGTDDGNIHVTRDDGKSWNKINKGLPDKWCSRIIASQHKLNRVYATFTGYREDDFTTYVYMSEDFGQNWKSIKSNLPDEMVNVIREDPGNPEQLFLGTDLGVYLSQNLGKSWHSLCNNLPTTAVYDLVVHPRDDKLVIGTHGRSTFILEISSL